MYKVKYIADGMIIWHGTTVIGIKGMTLPEMFDDCDCYKLPGNAFDYALSPHNQYTKEQKDYIDQVYLDWRDSVEEDEPIQDIDDRYYADDPGEDNNFFEDDELPF